MGFIRRWLTGPVQVDETVTERGVYWNRDRRGRIQWFYDEAQQWIPWRPGADSPPPPPGWEPWSTRTRARRLALRAVPVLLAGVIIIVGFLQVSGKHNPKPTATNLVGSCLSAPSGSSGSFTQVGCTSSKARFEVVAAVRVLPGAKPACPKVTAATIEFKSAHGAQTYDCLKSLSP